MVTAVVFDRFHLAPTHVDSLVYLLCILIHRIVVIDKS